MFPDQPLHVALGRLGGAAFLPVVERHDPSHLVGIVTLPDILAAYDAARRAPAAQAAVEPQVASRKE